MNAIHEHGRTGAKPKVVEGVTFHCHRNGTLRYEWRSEDGRVRCGDRSGTLSTYYAIVDGAMWSTRFRSLENAMRAAITGKRT